MFRRLLDNLPPDHVFPTDLTKLGYFVNEEDQIRQIANPDHKYQYKINRNDRVNDVYKESMNACIRRIVQNRLTDELNLVELRLPLGVTKTDKHIPILVSPNLETKKHVIVYFSERQSDLGVLSYRVIGEEGINQGSIYNFVKGVLQDPNAELKQETTSDDPRTGGERPGLIVANVGQLIWYRGGGRAVSDREWNTLPRPSAVHGPLRLDEVKNRVQGQEDFRAHVRHIFENLVLGTEDRPGICHPDARVSVVGQEFPGAEALEYLTNNWSNWRDRVTCVALINPQHTLDTMLGHLDPDQSADVALKQEITDFVAKRCRAYRLDKKPLEALTAGRSELGCNTYSAGETLYEESCFIRCWPSVLDWIGLCNFSKTYQEPDLGEPLPDEGQETEKARFRSPRKPQDDELAEQTRYQGELELEPNKAD